MEVTADSYYSVVLSPRYHSRFFLGMCGSSEADVQTAGFDLLTIRIESESFLNEISISTSDIYSQLESLMVVSVRFC